MKCKDCRCSRLGFFASEPLDYVCIGVKHPFIIEDINKDHPECGLPIVEPPPIITNWIPVSERYPTEEGRYLLVKESKYGGITSQRYIIVGAFTPSLEELSEWDFEGLDRPGFCDYNSECGFYELSNITHWMPLPELP